MGIAPPSKPLSSPHKPFRYERGSNKILQRLILLHDWQRVLIRARLFPGELSRPVHFRRGDMHLKVLPLHLVCALDPPFVVVELFLKLYNEAATVPVQPQVQRPGRVLPRGRAWKAAKRKIQQWNKNRHVLPRGPISHHAATPEKRNLGDPEKKRLLDDNREVNESSVYYSAPNAEIPTSDDDEASSKAGSSLSSRESAEQSVILQLSPSGGLAPLFLHANDTASTSDTTTKTHTRHFRVHWDLEPLRQEVLQRASLLPLHIACLFGASSPVLQILADTFPIAALSDILGMLPIHWIAAGWILAPLVPAPVSLVPPAAKTTGTREALRVMKDILPESLRIQSGIHGMTPVDYVLECMEEGDYKESCLTVLNDDLDEHASLSSACSLLFMDSSTDSSLCFSVASQRVGSLSGLIAEKNWAGVLRVVEDDPACASKWLYGIDQDVSKAPVVWKRLPIHLCCSQGAPVGILQALLSAHPTGIAIADPHSAALPLHLVCQLATTTKMAAPDQLAAVKWLVRGYPDATKAVDIQGRLPLHVAVLNLAPYSVVETLVEEDPETALIPDLQGKTALSYALQTYGREHICTELLSMVQIFAGKK